MRHLILALMILLLPLRGWAGDAMATNMAAGQLTVLQAAQPKVTTIATESIAIHDHNTWVTDHNHSKNAGSRALNDAEPQAGAQTAHDCGMQAMEMAHSLENSGMDCGTCASCQACHTVALSPVAYKSIAIFNSASQPEAATLPLASADRALSQKPPIS